MYEHILICLKKKGASAKLGFSRLDALRFFLGSTVQYGRHQIKNQKIYVDLFQGDLVPSVPLSAVKSATYQSVGTKAKHSNGEGHFGDVRISSRSIDGAEHLHIHGPDHESVMSVLEDFRSGKLPLDWEERSAERTIPRKPRTLTCMEEQELYDAGTNLWGGYE